MTEKTVTLAAQEATVQNWNGTDHDVTTTTTLATTDTVAAVALASHVDTVYVTKFGAGPDYINLPSIPADWTWVRNEVVAIGRVVGPIVDIPPEERPDYYGAATSPHLLAFSGSLTYVSLAFGTEFSEQSVTVGTMAEVTADQVRDQLARGSSTATDSDVEVAYYALRLVYDAPDPTPVLTATRRRLTRVYPIHT